MDPSSMFGPIDALTQTQVEFLLLGLVILNMVTRILAHRTHVQQAEDGAEAISRYVPHEAANVVLVLASFYYLTIAHHGGMILSMLVVGTVITDFFEFEARKVEARRDEPLDRPKAAVIGSVFVLMYAAYQSLFFVVEPLWNGIV
ncbi:hypothetical protein G9464_07170 [Halostella sp. JP-L12]|uniref:DUF7313 family protein n=1 Tax=Halostella TaxID=1843185 RepID=UPI000EF816C2|nr:MULTISPECIES: hypothetical protein [Halostella]NHN47374.1 hypothetical protein [Halostella sp. JP-L12]